ncbi:MAG TPA: hypothetical protein VMH39_09745, partial [Gemmatimonadaceae bacterium]|nr:hypothetical protein [Gemmatimonadaceae bacterium]
MVLWLVAIGVGVAFALVQYGWRRPPFGRAPLVAATLRLMGVSLIVAVLLNAPVAPERPPALWAALDASQSMTRGDSSLWRAGLDSLRSAHADSQFVFGDSARAAPKAPVSGDLGSTVRPVIDRAASSGHGLLVITDGEVDDPDAMSSLPAGSRVVVLARRPAADAAVTAVDAPEAVVAGDSTAIRVAVSA